MEGLGRYHAAGARFCAVTDHDHVTDLSAARARWPGMTLLEGFEWSTSENILFIGSSVPRLYELPLADALRIARNLLTIVCHPKPSRDSEYWTVPMIMALDPTPVGLEIYNAHYARPHVVIPRSNPLYTETWDALLGSGMHIWGFANDDSHDPHDYGATRTMAYVENSSTPSVLAALRAGRFYGSTGLLLESVGLAGAVISVRLAEHARGRFVGPGGKTLSGSEGKDFAYTWAGEPYVRFEAEGKPGRIFLQPFFAE